MVCTSDQEELYCCNELHLGCGLKSVSGNSFQPAMRCILMKCLCICILVYNLGCRLKRGDLLECSLVGELACQLQVPDVDQTLANPAPSGKHSSLRGLFLKQKSLSLALPNPQGVSGGSVLQTDRKEQSSVILRKFSGVEAGDDGVGALGWGNSSRSLTKCSCLLHGA